MTSAEEEIRQTFDSPSASDQGRSHERHEGNRQLTRRTALKEEVMSDGINDSYTHTEPTPVAEQGDLIVRMVGAWHNCDGGHKESMTAALAVARPALYAERDAQVEMLPVFESPTAKAIIAERDAQWMKEIHAIYQEWQVTASFEDSSSFQFVTEVKARLTAPPEKRDPAVKLVESMIHGVSTRSDMPNWTQVATEIVDAVCRADAKGAAK
jgi:hypothetical protein